MTSTRRSGGCGPGRRGTGKSRRRIRERWAEWRRLARIAYRDPEHVAERLALFGSERLGDPSLEWANGVREERPDAPKAEIAEEVRIQTAQVARIDGAVSGTPFLIALVPGYLAYLWQEGVMERRIAALYGSRPSRGRDLRADAGVARRPSDHRGRPRGAPEGRRRPRCPRSRPRADPLRIWVRSVYVLLIFGGFLSAPTEEAAKEGHWRLKATVGFVVGGVIWVMTWVLPVSFMIVMAWACESHARSLGSRTLSFYGGESAAAELAAGSVDDWPRRRPHQARPPARGAPGALDRDPHRLRRLRGPCQAEHGRQLARCPRRTRRGVARHRDDGHRQTRASRQNAESLPQRDAHGADG